MPLYEYECKSCGHRFEKILKFSDPPVTACPNCKQESVEQMISAPAVQFKGSGFYATDYASNKSGGSAPGANSNDSSQGEAKSETAKNDSKSDPSGSKSDSGASTSAKTPTPTSSDSK